MKGIRTSALQRGPTLPGNMAAVDMICEAVSMGLPYEQAATLAGYSVWQTRKLRKDAIALIEGTPASEQFDEQWKALLRYFISKITAAEAKGEHELLKVMYEAATKQKDWKAADRLLQILNPSRYSPKRVHTSQPALPSTSTQVFRPEELSDDELIKIVEGQLVPEKEVTQSSDEVMQVDESVFMPEGESLLAEVNGDEDE